MNSTEEMTSSSAFALALAQSRADVDRVLDGLPEIRQEARRVITRELNFSPTPEQLRMIDSMAHGEVAQSPLQESLRSILALRLVATHATEEVLNAPDPTVDRLRRSGELMSPLITAVRYMEEAVRTGVEGMAPADRDRLLQTAQALLPSRDLLIAGAVLAPRLARAAEAGEQGDLGARVPRLSDEDAALIRTAVASNENWTDGACRVCFNALTLRALIEDDLAAWESSRDDTESDSSRPDTRERNLATLEQDRIAYGVLAEQLQIRQDTALVAGLREFADELSRVKGELFSAYLKLAPVLRKASREDSADPEEGEATLLDIESLLEECSQADKLAEVQQAGKVDTDEVYLDALRDMDGQGRRARPAVKRARERNVERERRRVRVMVGIAAVLVVVAVVQQGFLLRGTPQETVRLDVTDFPGKALLNEAMAVGPMMYAQISHFSWNDLTVEQRVRRVEDLALVASDRGFETLYLTDENQIHLATWNKTDGVKLMDSETSLPSAAGSG